MTPEADSITTNTLFKSGSRRVRHASFVRLGRLNIVVALLGMT